MSNIALNYVWIHRAREDGSLVCEIPDYLMKNMLKQASGQPDAQCFLWVDFRRTSDDDLALLRRDVAGAGLQVRDLCSVQPAYKSYKMFDLGWNPLDIAQRPHGAGDHHMNLRHSDPVWFQADFARLLVLYHCLTQDGFDQAFYSDMDVANLDLQSEPLTSAFNKNGMCFILSDGRLSNSFIGFSAYESDFLGDKIIGGIEERVASFMRGGCDLRVAWCNMFREPLSLRVQDIDEYMSRGVRLDRLPECH